MDIEHNFFLFFFGLFLRGVFFINYIVFFLRPKSFYFFSDDLDLFIQRIHNYLILYPLASTPSIKTPG